MKVAYLLSSSTPYENLICEDAGPPIALEYGWQSSNMDFLCNNAFDCIVVDNRHHDQFELTQLRSYIQACPSIPFLLRVNDPYLFHRQDFWYQFCSSLLDVPNVHFLSPYQPTGFLSIWLSHSKYSRFVYAPYTYDSSREHVCTHATRFRRIAVSGNQRLDLYPLRHSIQRASKFRLTRFLLRTDRLVHPGYPEKNGPPSHHIMGSKYIRWLSSFTAAFTDSSIYRIEFLKYREVAYAGCAPVGDLPWSLFDCPPVAFREFRSLLDLIRLRSFLQDPQATEEVAHAYRTYMRSVRCRDYWRATVAASISQLI